MIRRSKPNPHAGRPAPGEPRTGLARALSKLGHCSRSQGFDLVRAGKVLVNGVTRTDPEWPVSLKRDRIQVEGQRIESQRRVYLMLNKPRGLVTTASDEQGRKTVYSCFEGKGLPFMGPVGRLDQASEGLLLFSNDTAWADHITRPDTAILKRYHVQINRPPDEALLEQIRRGVSADGEPLRVKSANWLRSGGRTSWLEIVLDEGRNRHIRRIAEALDLEVLRLVRIAIGALELGPLPKGEFRHLTPGEVRQFQIPKPLQGRAMQ